MKFHLWFPAALATLTAAVGAEPPVFNVTDAANLQAAWRGKPLIVGERFSLLERDGFRDAQAREEQVGKHRVFNRFGDVSGVPFRREVAVKDGGKELEISFQMNFPAYNATADSTGKGYSLYFPYADFAGWKYTAVVGRISGTKELTGTLAADAPDGNLLKTAIRQITLESPDGGRKLVIDCSPEGVNDFYSDYPPNGIMSLWGFQRQGDALVVTIGYTPHFYGGAQTGKVQLYEGAGNSYDQRHAHRSFRYFSELKPDRQYVFGAEKFGSMYIPVGTRSFTAENKAGWVGADALRVEKYAPSGALYSAVGSERANVFKMSGLRRGLHLLTLGVPTFAAATGPMNISVNGAEIVKALKLPPQEVTMITAPVWIENGTAEIAFSGRWRIATVNDQLLQSSAEDFSFRRGFWVSTAGPHPAVMFQSSHYTAEPAYRVGVAGYPLPRPGEESAAPRRNLTYPTGHAKIAPEKDWRGGAMLGSWGPANNGSFAEFSAPGAIQRRLKELREEKIDAVIINGLLSRHTYPAHTDRVEKTLAEIVKAGHAQNIKFIDHWDFSMLWQCDSGFRVLTERMGGLQQTIDCGLPARGLCPTNPEMRKIFFAEVLRHIKATDLDGLMVDEAAFHGANFCGCPECRRQFTRDTGWMLPADETSPELRNKLSPLWRAWQSWRQKAIGDFWVALRAEVAKLKPEFVFIGYTTHYGMYSYYAPLELGVAMEQLCRAWDFVGTEIMSRNIFASYRSVNCFRKMKNMYRNVYGTPTFGLVYSDARDWDVMYFGWALNNMNAQTTWEMSGVRRPEGKPNYRKFTVADGNMDQRTAKPRAEIAMLFSNLGRDCERGASAHVDIMGLSQVLSANHVPHEFIFEAGLTPEILNRYKVLVVGNATAMSEADVKAIRAFAEAGGTVFLSSHAGYYNEIAMKRPHWLVGRELLANSDYGSRDYGAEFFAVKDPVSGRTTPVGAKSHFMRYKFDPSLETVLELVVDKAGKTTVPGLVCHRLGKGEVYFTPVSFGAHSSAFEVSSGQKMAFEKNAAADALAFEVLKRVAGKHFVWEPVNIPEAVLTSLYTTGTGKTVVHFLNATKSTLKKGEICPSVPPAGAFAPLAEAMSFRIAQPGVKRVYAVSPEFAAPRELPFQTLPDGRVEVTVPGGTLGAYMLVYLE